MDKYIPLLPGQPDARKKGLRMEITGITVDDAGRVTSLFYRASSYKTSGGGILRLDKDCTLKIKGGGGF